MSFTWTYSDHAKEGLFCIQQARNLADAKTNSTVRSYLAAVEAVIQATLGEHKNCLQALEDAESVENYIQDTGDNYWLRFDASRLSGYQGSCFLRLYNRENQSTIPFLSKAQKALDNGLSHLSPSMVQRRPAILINLAKVYAQQGEIETACMHAIQSTEFIKQVKSNAAIKRLQQLQQYLVTWKNTQAVRNLNECIEPLLKKEEW